MADTATKTTSKDPGKSWADLKSKIAEFKGKEALLTPTEWEQYSSLISQANQGPENYQDLVNQGKQNFSDAIFSTVKDFAKGSLSDDRIRKAADEAAQHFVGERNTGAQSLSDFIGPKLAGGGSQYSANDFGKALEGLSSSVGSYIPQGPGDYINELTRVNTSLAQSRKSQGQAQNQAQTQGLSQQQQQQAQQLQQAALQQLGQPAGLFTDPTLTQAALDQLRGMANIQGETGRQNVEASAANRGITGSSIEQFGLAQNQNMLDNTIAQQTLNFLLQSGQMGEQNKQFIVQQLQNQANSLLGASQGTAQLATTQDFGQQGIDLQRVQMQQQLQMYNQNFQETQRQFDQTLQYQQSQAAQNMQLLLHQLGRGSGVGLGASVLSGTATGAGLGAFGGTPLSVGIGSGLGALYGLGTYYGNSQNR